jgi:endonuclease III
MYADKNKIIGILTKKGSDLLNGHREEPFSNNVDADKLLRDIKRYPHAYVLACVMDRQIKAERAWEIPYKVSQEIGGFDFDRLSRLSLAQIKGIFKKNRLHRFNEKISECFYLAIQKIKIDYQGDASKIWNDCPPSAAVVRRFLEFKGVGVKIATMAANILARSFKVPMKDHICIDISPDVHIKRVFQRLGLILKGASIDEIIYCARELNPEYPGIFDPSCWEIGRKWCRPNNPACDECYLNSYCPKII